MSRIYDEVQSVFDGQEIKKFVGETRNLADLTEPIRNVLSLANRDSDLACSLWHNPEALRKHLLMISAISIRGIEVIDRRLPNDIVAPSPLPVIITLPIANLRDFSVLDRISKAERAALGPGPYKIEMIGLSNRSGVQLCTGEQVIYRQSDVVLDTTSSSAIDLLESRPGHLAAIFYNIKSTMSYVTGYRDYTTGQAAMIIQISALSEKTP